MSNLLLCLLLARVVAPPVSTGGPPPDPGRKKPTIAAIYFGDAPAHWSDLLKSGVIWLLVAGFCLLAGFGLFHNNKER
jgi:hypothetical protein